MTRPKPILCLDFDGVLHNYSSGWKGEAIIPDPPVKGAIPFLRRAIDEFDVQIFSSRSKTASGVSAMKQWLREHVEDYYDCLFHMGRPKDFDSAQKIINAVSFPTTKPSAFVTIDDRAITFEGVWPEIDELMEFQPWNRRTGSSGRTLIVNPDAPLIRRIRTALRLIAHVA